MSDRDSLRPAPYATAPGDAVVPVPGPRSVTTRAPVPALVDRWTGMLDASAGARH